MNPKVCFFGGTRYDRPLDATGEKKFRIMKSLASIDVVAFSRDLRWRKFTEHARFWLLPQLPLPVLRYLELFVVGQLVLLWLILRRRVQVVVAQSPYEGFVAALVIRLAGWLGYDVKLVVEIHGDFQLSLFLQREIRHPGLYRFAMSRMARCAITRADVLRVISDSTKEQVKRWAPKKTIVQFPAWTDIEAFLRSDKRASTDSSQVVLYVGVLTPLKGVHHLVNAFVPIAKDFPTVQLKIVGKNENKTYAADLKTHVDTLDLSVRVQFIEPMPQSELASWMADASVLVLPSKSEGLPRVIVEAMATGTPVIGSCVGGIPELIEDGSRGFLVAPENEQMLTERIRWILENPLKAQAMGRKGRAFAAQFFSTEVYMDGYRKIFQTAQSSPLGKHATINI